jgi:hypothetical protein
MACVNKSVCACVRACDRTHRELWRRASQCCHKQWSLLDTSSWSQDSSTHPCQPLWTHRIQCAPTVCGSVQVRAHTHTAVPTPRVAQPIALHCTAPVGSGAAVAWTVLELTTTHTHTHAHRQTHSLTHARTRTHALTHTYACTHAGASRDLL